MKSSRPTTLQESVHTGRHHDGSMKIVRRWEGWRSRYFDTHNMVAPGLRMVRDVADHILAPDEWMVIIGLELLRNKFCPGIKGL